MTAAGYEITRPGEEPERISAQYAAMLYREAQASGEAKLSGDLDGGFTYQSVIGECAVTPVREEVGG